MVFSRPKFSEIGRAHAKKKQAENTIYFFPLVFARIGGKRTRAKDQKHNIYFKQPNQTYCVHYK